MIEVYTGMANVAFVDAGEATLACMPIVNTHEINLCVLPMSLS